MTDPTTKDTAVAWPTQSEIKQALTLVEECLALRVQGRAPPYSNERMLGIVRAALASRPAPEGQWQPIATAPTEPNNYDDPLDIWVRNNKDGREWREVRCHFAMNKCWVNGSGKWFTGKRYYDESEQDEVYDPACADEQSIVATHWLRPHAPNVADSDNASEWIWCRCWPPATSSLRRR